ncbi:MAG: MBL fold metallo-hydrolase [Desulfobacterales bacterium]|nr:MAG: MBL fold metallo-hydrolase [Desulfobacterales bacterium]
MIEIAPDIYLIPGKNKSRFPYCACLYLKGRDLRILIDAGMGEANMAPVLEAGIDVLILSHCHVDHRLTRRLIPEVPVWCHVTEIEYLTNREKFIEGVGFRRGGIKASDLIDKVAGFFDMTIERILGEGDEIDLGGLKLVCIHTPGHTPGHLSFFIPEHQLLFSADVDLSRFGPFYGHDFANIDDFILSIQKLKQVKAQIIATSHAGPFNGNIRAYLDAYEEVIYNRDQLLLENLEQPKTLKSFYESNLIYRLYPQNDNLIKWFELVHIEKHLSRLAGLGKVHEVSGKWIRR